MKHLWMLLFSCVLLGSSCEDIKDKKTTLEITRNNRHYYPIQRGVELEMAYLVKNTGANPFVLSDVFTSCGCVVVEASSISTIPPGRESWLILKYNSSKNVGFVQHNVTLYGNFSNTPKMDITFDIHVVPDAPYTKDYEEIYQGQRGVIKEMVDGDLTNKIYYTDNDQ